MSYKELDESIVNLAAKEMPYYEAATGFLTLKKLASGGVPNYNSEAVRSEQIPELLVHLVSEEFQKHASGGALNRAEYFLTQLKALDPASLNRVAPVAEGVKTAADKVAMCQRSVVLMDKLSNLVGADSPMYPTLRHFIKQDLADIKAMMPKQASKTAHDKFMSRLRKIATDLVDPDTTNQQEETTTVPQVAPKAKAAPVTKAAPGPKAPVLVPPPNDDTPEDYVARERQLAYDQALQELAHTKLQLNETAMVAQQAAAEGQQAQQALEETQAMAEEANQAAQMSGQQAVEAESRAAQHATQKMQLGMRVQQMRQALAEIATQDPVTETGADINDLAAQEAPATPDQMAQAEEEQAMAEEQAAAAPPTAEQKKEVQQADRAQQEAAKQTEQAAAAVAPAAPAQTPAGAPAGAPPGMAAA